MITINATEKEVKIIVAIGSALRELEQGPTRHQTFARLVKSYAGRGVSEEEIEFVLKDTFLGTFVVESELQ